VFKVGSHYIDQKLVECKRAVPKEPTNIKLITAKTKIVKPSVKPIVNGIDVSS